MYLLGYLPYDTVVVFKVGKRLTQKKREQCASILRYNKFTLDKTGGFSTENVTSVRFNNDNIHFFDITK